MPLCDWCGANQPDPELLAVHQDRFCKSKPAVVAAPVAVTASKNGKHAAAAATVQVAEPALPQGIYRPRADTNFYLPVWIGRALDRLVPLSDEAPINLMLRGPQGSGKTSLARQIAAKYGRPFCSIEFGKIQEPREIFGGHTYDPKEGLQYIRSLLWRATETEGCVVLLDELNRCENPKVLSPLFSLLDDRRQAWVDEVQAFLSVAPRVIFIATINEGMEFAGVDPVDAALRDRFHEIELVYPSDKAMEAVLVAKSGVTPDEAHTLVKLTSAVFPLSKAPMRALLRSGLHLRLGSNLQESLRVGFSGAEPDILEKLLQVAETYGSTDWTEEALWQ